MKISLKYPWSISWGLKNKFQTAKVNEPSVFESLRFTYFSCEYDNLTLSSLHDTKEVTFCGDWNDKLKKLRWTSDDNTLVLSFLTDHSKNYPGFKATIGYTDLGKAWFTYHIYSIYFDTL